MADAISRPLLLREMSLSNNRLAGLRLLLLEDEFLIAMDVEQLCHDHGAAEVVIVRSLADAVSGGANFDAAIVDVMLGGESTLPYAAQLRENGVPFIFASGYSDRKDIEADFPGVAIVGKPFSGEDLVAALAAAIAGRSGQG